MWITVVVVLSLLTGGVVYWLSLRALGEGLHEAAPRVSTHDRAPRAAAIGAGAGVEGRRWFLTPRRGESKESGRISWDDGPALRATDTGGKGGERGESGERVDRPGEHIVVVPIGADPPSTKSRILGLLGIVVLVAVGGALTALAVWQAVLLVVRQIDRYFAST